VAKKRFVDTRFWNDHYISNLDPSEKLLFLYFLTNSFTNICGVYEIPLKTIACDTGIDKDMIEKMVIKFSRDNKIHYKLGWCVITNFLKHQNTNNSKVQTGIKNEQKSIPVEVLQFLDEINKDNPNYCSYMTNKTSFPKNIGHVCLMDDQSHPDPDPDPDPDSDPDSDPDLDCINKDKLGCSSQEEINNPSNIILNINNTENTNPVSDPNLPPSLEEVLQYCSFKSYPISLGNGFYNQKIKDNWEYKDKPISNWKKLIDSWSTKHIPRDYKDIENPQVKAVIPTRLHLNPDEDIQAWRTSDANVPEFVYYMHKCPNCNYELNVDEIVAATENCSKCKINFNWLEKY
jgi:transcription initiation factor IIE alpha subunit